MDAIQINEPSKKILLSIDFGTSKSVIGYSNPQANLLESIVHEENFITNDLKFMEFPTIITIDENNFMTLDQQNQIKHSLINIRSIKRTLGLANLKNTNLEYFFDFMIHDNALAYNTNNPEIFFKLNANKIISNLDLVTFIFSEFKSKLIKQFSKNISEDLIVANNCKNSNELESKFQNELESKFQNETQEINISHKKQISRHKEFDFEAILTAPVYFDELTKAQLRLCAEKAGFKVIKVIPEPVAAIYAHDLKDGICLVFDLGAGTYDLSLIQMKNNVYRVLGNDGNRYIGGDDIDILIAKYLVKKYGTRLNYHIRKVTLEDSKGLDNSKDLEDSKGLEDLDKSEDSKGLADSKDLDNLKDKNLKNSNQALILLGRKIKEYISDEKKDFVQFYDIALGPNEPSLIIEITKTEFDNIIENFKHSLINILKNFLNLMIKTHGSQKKIDSIVFAGRASKIAGITETIENLIPDASIYTLTNPETTVSLGAIKHGYSKIKLFQVAPLSLGIEIMGGMVGKIIERNAQLPIVIKKTFTNYSEQQTKVRINILEGERDLVAFCKSLGVFEIDIPKAKPGTLRIDISFSLDIDANLLVTAEVNNIMKQLFRYEPFKNINVINEIKSSIQYHHQDTAAKHLAEDTIKARLLISDIEKLMMLKNFMHLKNNKRLQDCLFDLKQAIEAQNYEDILRNISFISGILSEIKMNEQ